jgi:ADP-ribosyl-[dinitrogen reductase] hydrolase
MPSTDASTSPARQDAALGAILGALAGDAAGAVLEFIGHPPSPPEVDRALRYPGGGVHGVAPGQITDDGELTLCLLHALAEAPEFSLDRIAKWYGRWINSSPFDVGNATSVGFGPARDLPFADVKGLAAQMQAESQRLSSGSKANGSLMRCTPIGVWGHALDDDALVACARADSSLTHPNPACGDAVAAYSLAIAHLVREPGDRSGAWDRARAWVDREACEDVRGWMDAAERDLTTDYLRMIGFVKHGFTEAFRQLRRGADWETAVRETLMGGGDTDTNACIVGGLIGAASGADAMPVLARGMVLDCDTRSGKQRPEWLHPSGVDVTLRIIAS